MMKVCEKFPQIGTLDDYIALPPGEKAIYNQYVIYEMEQEAKTPVLKIGK